MNLTRKVLLIVLSYIIHGVVFAHEGLHSSGQVHAGENHMGLLEIALALIALACIAGYVLKNHKSNK